MRLALVLAAAALLGGAGCQTFLGIEDPAQHLPRLDGNYVVAIERLRPSDGTTIDVITMQGTASLDPSTRILDLSMNILPFGGGAPLSETSISGIEFPDDNDEAVFELSLTIPAGAITGTPPPNAGAGDLAIQASVRIIAEADYSFCAKPLNGALPTMGSLLVDSFASIPATADGDCDDPARP